MRLSSFSCTKDGGGNCGKFRNFPSKKSAKREVAQFIEDIKNWIPPREWVIQAEADMEQKCKERIDV